MTQQSSFCLQISADADKARNALFQTVKILIAEGATSITVSPQVVSLMMSTENIIFHPIVHTGNEKAHMLDVRPCGQVSTIDSDKKIDCFLSLNFSGYDVLEIDSGYAATNVSTPAA